MKSKLLLVEDDIVDRISFERFAQTEELSFEYAIATSVVEAKHRLSTEKYDIVIADFQLGDGTAFELFNTANEVPLILVTGMGNEEIAVKAMKSGAYDYVIKDPDGNYLKTIPITVENAIQRNKTEHELKRYREQLEELVTNRTQMLQIEVEERKRAEEAVKKLNDQLEEKVAQRTADLNRINLQLSQSLKILREDEEAGKLVQFSLLPKKSNIINNYHIGHFLQPSMYLSGDFLDYFEIDDNHLGFYVVDVAGHGAPSAFVTVLLKNQMTTSLERYKNENDCRILDPESVLKALNTKLIKQNINRHITFLYGIIDSQTNSFVFANGGQFPPPMIFSNGKVISIESNGKPLGLFDSVNYKNITVQLPKQFILALFSDGILDILPQVHISQKIEFLMNILKISDINIDIIIDKLKLNKQKSLPDDISILMIKNQ
jgi:phosphoserine phosphatase RsbU/P